jgi:hypothetical protein
MELSLERGCVPPGSRGGKGGMPLILNFAASPNSFAETAFSFDIDQDNCGCSSGCGFVTIISPNMNITSNHLTGSGIPSGLRGADGSI